ncbi:MAG TPA: hypothetical protein VKH81_06375 [Candidatus Angelobacter sp.]|nr:hypothetical protein [Candidatus Angelobacter sp.]
MLVKVAFVLLAVSIGAILVAVGAMRWRLGWHLRRPDVTPPAPALESPQQDPVEKTKANSA